MPDLAVAMRHARHVLSRVRSSLEREHPRGLEGDVLELSIEIERLRLLALSTRGRRDLSPQVIRFVNELRGLLEDKHWQRIAGAVRVRFMANTEFTGIPWLEKLSSNRKGTPARDVLVGLLNFLERIDVSSDLFESHQKGSDINKLRKLVPSQKIAPAQFEIVDGRLTLAKARNKRDPADAGSIRDARDALISTGTTLVKELQHSNCDKRLLETVKSLQEQLLEQKSIIGLGLAALACSAMCVGFRAELPVAVSSMLTGYTKGLELYVGQFPEWSRFVENAAAAQLTNSDVQHVYEATKQIVEKLKTKTDIVDPKVPATLAAINEFLRAPASTAKRAAFALLRSIENLVSKSIDYGMDFLEETLDKTKERGSTVASKVIIVSFLTLALYSTGAIGGVAGKIGEMAWLNNAAKIVQNELERLTTSASK